MSSKKTIFKINDRVFDILFGWGTVKHINNMIDDFCVQVTFDSKLRIWYTANGALNELYTPTLSFTEYTIKGLSQTRPKAPLKYKYIIKK